MSMELWYGEKLFSVSVTTKVRRPGRPFTWVYHGRHGGLSLDSQSTALGCPQSRAIESKPDVTLWYTAALSRVDME